MYLSTLLAKAKWYPVLFDSPLNAVRSVAIWLTLALLILGSILLFLLKGERKRKFIKYSFFFALVYACVLGSLYLIFTFQEDGIEKILFIPLLVLLCCIIGSAILLSYKRSATLYALCGSVVALAFVAVFVCMVVHFVSGNGAENNGLTNADVSSLALYVSAALLVCALVAVALFVGKKDKKGFDSKSVTYAGICIAISFALSYLRLVRMPQGGSITPASILPLMIYSYMFGVKKGIFVGFTYGLLQGIQDPYVLHPAQFLLDYPVAYACIGLAGIFSHTKSMQKYPQTQIALGGVIAGLSRFLMHFLSGVFAFGTFAPEGTSPALYSLGYQAGYVLPDIAIAVAVAVFVFSSKTFVRELKKIPYRDRKRKNRSINGDFVENGFFDD